MNTPWGPSQTRETIDPGFVLVTTAGHGGIMVDRDAVRTLPANILPAAISYGQWLCFEEDCTAGLVFGARPDIYRKHLQHNLDGWNRTLSGDHVPDYAVESGPECVKKLTEKLALSDEGIIEEVVKSNHYWYPELFGLGKRCDECKQIGCAGHKDQLIVVSAFGDWHKDVPKGMVGVVAILGGRYGQGADRTECYFLVDHEEYSKKKVFFVVAPERHAVWETEMAPSTKQVILD